MCVQQRTFRLTPRRKWLVLTTIAFFLGLPTLLAVGGIASGDKDLVTTGAIIGVIMMPFALFLWFCTWYPRLTLSSAGVEVKGTGGFGSISIPWRLVERLRLDPGSEALIVSEPMDTKYTRSLRNWSGFTYKGAQFHSAEQQSLMADERYIPLEAYAGWFERGDLLSVFRQFAPQLVEHFTEEREAARERQSKDKWIVAVIFGVTAIILVLAVLAGIFGSDLSPATQQRWARITSGWDVFVVAAMGTVLAVYSLVNFKSALHFIREKQFGLGMLWLGVAAVQVLCALACVGWLLQ